MAEQRRREMVFEDRRDEVYVSGGRAFLELPDGITMWNPKGDKFRIEILPYQVTKAINRFTDRHRASSPGRWYWERTIEVHYGVGPAEKSVVCPRMIGQPCPVCERAQVLKASQLKLEQDLSARLRSKTRNLFVVTEYNEKSGDLSPPMVWEVSYYNFMKQMELKWRAADAIDKEGYRHFYRPDDGYTLKLVTSEEDSGMGRKYLKFYVDEFKARRSPIPDELIDHGIDLDAIVKVLSYDEIADMLTVPDQDDPEGEPETTASAKTSAPTREAPREREKDPEPAKREAPARTRKPDPAGDKKPAEPETYDLPGAADDRHPPEVGDKVEVLHRGEWYEGDVRAIDDWDGKPVYDVFVNEFDKIRPYEADEVRFPQADDADPPPEEKPAPAARGATAPPATSQKSAGTDRNGSGRGSKWKDDGEDDRTKAPPAQTDDPPARGRGGRR